MAYIKYVNKTDCEQVGYVRTGQGVYRLSALERLHNKGRLNYGDKKYGAGDRLRAGERLASDYEKARFDVVSSSWSREKVDCSGKGKDFLTDVRSKYLTAIRHIPREFWPAVRTACIENRLPEEDKDDSARRRQEKKYVWCCDLCRGLDRLIEYYQKSKIIF